MANKYERRRRSLKETQVRGENPFASPRSSPAVGRKAQPQSVEASGHRAGRRVVIAICCLLVLGSATVYVQAWQHDFVNCDDDEYVYENPDIQRGLTPASAWWAITQAHSANWHPLTWMSHTIDWQVFGTWDADRQHYVDSWPGGHHLVNLLLHAVNAVLLFLVLQEMTGATWPSAVRSSPVCHPSAEGRIGGLGHGTQRHAQRTVFSADAGGLPGLRRPALLLVALWAGDRQFRPGAYGQVDVGDAAVGVALAGLLAVATHRPAAERRCRGASFSRLLPLRVILEKIPLLALSAGSCELTVWAQSLVGAFKPLDFQYRVGNALLSYAAYIGQMFYPAGMVVQYVHPGPNLRWLDALLPLAVLFRSRWPSSGWAGGGATWPSAGSGIWACSCR